jgi:hypothetical protein
MKKIPVGATIARAYRFAFGDFFRILGVIWLPWAIISVGGFLVLRTSAALSAAMASNNTANAGRIMVALGPFYLATVILLFMQITGITELALGLRKGSPYYYFSLGKPVWRVIGAFLLLALVVIISAVAMVAGGIALGFITKLLNVPVLTTLIFLLGGVSAFCAYIYVLVRCSFLLIPVIIAEEKISLKGAWVLGRGSFWRMFAILLAIIVPALAIEMVFMFKFVLQGMPFAPPNATPDQLAAYRAALTAWNLANAARIKGDWYIFYPGFAIFSALFYGLSSGSQAFAYRALTETDSTPNPL